MLSIAGLRWFGAIDYLYNARKRVNLMFGLFGKRKLKKQVEESLRGFNEIWDADYDDIWKIENKNNFLIAMNGWLCKKCNYGEYIGKLSSAERVFYCNTQVEQEVNNGGFSQFFFNSSGNFANEVADSLREIGANKMADICNKALIVLNSEIPVDLEERQNKLEEVLTDEINDILNECDNEFYKYPDNLEELNYQYILANKAQFTRT